MHQVAAVAGCGELWKCLGSCALLWRHIKELRYKRGSTCRATPTLDGGVALHAAAAVGGGGVMAAADTSTAIS
jgi:hypothetical protein